MGVLTLNLLGFISCLDCDQYRYYDFSGIEAEVRNPVVQVADSLSFGYRITGTNFLSYVRPNPFANAAYAMECDKGFDGAKYPPVRIDITSDTDFDAAHPAGALLNDIVKVRSDIGQGEEIYGYLNQFNPGTINYSYMYITAKPQNDFPHRFTIEVEKSNGTIYSDTSEEIVWE